MALEQNWLDQAIAKLSCGLQFTSAELMSILFGLKVKTLLAKCPTIFEYDSTSNSDFTVAAIYERIKCNKLLTEAEYQQALTLLEVKEAICAASLLDDTVTEGEDCKIIASGIWIHDGSTQIDIDGVVETDIVVATLHTQDDDEAIVTAGCGVDRVVLTFSGTPAEDSTAVNYIVTRCAV